VRRWIIPPGTVYTVKIDSDNQLHAEAQGLPFTDTGLTMSTYEETVPDASAAGIRKSGEKLIRRLNLRKTQGRMMGDGGFASVYVWDGSATLGAHVGRPASWDEAGKEWKDLRLMVASLLPKDFIR